MSDIHGSAQADLYVQGESDKALWHTYYGEAGNDTIKMWMGQVIGGPGNDYIEQLPSTDWWRELAVAYWDAPAGCYVDLATGVAQDGWGGTDTLVGVDGVNTGWWDDTVFGNSSANNFSAGSGHDLFDGRGGIDRLVLPWLGSGPATTFDDFVIAVSTDGHKATITSPKDTHMLLELTDIELIAYTWDAGFVDLSNFIDPQDLAEQALVALPSQRWNAASPVGTGVTVSFSFVESSPGSGVGATGFRAFTAAERQVVRDVLSAISSETGLVFVENNEATQAAGQVRFGVSQQAATKGVTFAPSTNAGNPTAGDVWMDVESMLSLTPGTEGYAALLHEIGHALGLRHTRNVDAGDAWTQVFDEAYDSTSLTVMSQVASADGLFRGDWGALDIAALRYLYGSKAVNTGNSTYTVGALDAQAQRTIVDDGGTDVLDASASAVGVVLDLNPGARSSVGVTAQGLVAVDNLTIGLGTWIETAIGSIHDDVMTGNAHGNTFEGGLGNDVIDGGGGVDTARFAGNMSAYTLSEAFGYRYVTAKDGVSGFDTLINVERLQFADHSLTYDTVGNPGQAVKLLGAVVGASIAANPYYVGMVMNYLDGGMDRTALAGYGLEAVLGPNPSSTAVVNLLYHNLVGYYPSPADLASIAALIDNGTFTKAGLAVYAADMSLNAANVGLAGLAASGITYDPW